MYVAYLHSDYSAALMYRHRTNRDENPGRSSREARRRSPAEPDSGKLVEYGFKPTFLERLKQLIRRRRERKERREDKKRENVSPFLPPMTLLKLLRLACVLTRSS